MNRKSVETFMKKAMPFHAPENMWDKIKDQPIPIVSAEPQHKKSKTTQYALITSIAACLIIVSILVANNNNLFSPPPITSETLPGNNPSHAEPDVTSEQSTSNNKDVPNSQDTTSINSERGDDGMGVSIPIYKVWNHRLYQLSADSRTTELSDSDLEALHREIINNVEITAYSFKNIPMEQSIGDKKNGIVLRYDCIFNGVFNFMGKKYGIVDTKAYFYPEPEKGNYIGEIDGLKVYEFVGNKEALLIDLAKYINVGDSTDEILYVAELLE